MQWRDYYRSLIANFESGASLRRIVLGIFLAPLAPNILLFIVSLASPNHFSEWVWILCLSAIFSYPIVFIIGIPILLGALKFGFVQWYHSLICGALIGLATSYGFARVRAHNDGEDWWSAHLSNPSLTFLFVLWALIVSGSFWVISRPDKFRFKQIGS